MQNQLVILGGMGPQASLRLHQLLLELSRSFHQGEPDEYPAILHASMQVPDFISSTKRTADAVRVIRSTCAQLPMENASAIGLACNTAHLLLDELPLQSDKFVSMIDAVSTDITALGAERVGLLASPHTLRTKLYENALKAHGIGVVLPAETEMDKLNDIIHEVISGKEAATLRPRLNKLASALEARGADAILLGCTELPLVGVDTDLPVIDSLSSLATAMLRKINRDKV